MSSFGEQSPLFSKGFPKKNAKLISQTRATPNLIEKCSSHNAWYYIVAPPSGAQTVSCTTSGNFFLVAETYSGVDQSSPLDTIKYGQLYATSTSASVSPGGSLSDTGTTQVDGDWTVLGTNFGAGVAPGTGSTDRSGTGAGTYDSNGAITPAGATSMSLTNPTGVTTNIVEMMFGLFPAS